jgi:hypothetical protein
MVVVIPGINFFGGVQTKAFSFSGGHFFVIF